MDSEQAALREQTKRARRCEDERSLPAAAEDQQLPSQHNTVLLRVAGLPRVSAVTALTSTMQGPNLYTLY